MEKPRSLSKKKKDNTRNIKQSSKELITTLDSSNFLLSPPQTITLDELEAMDKSRTATWRNKTAQYTLDYKNWTSCCTVLYEGKLPEGLSTEEQARFMSYTVQKDGKDIVCYRYKTHPQTIETLNSSKGMWLRKNYYMADMLSYKLWETNPLSMTISEVVDYIKNKRIFFYTWAWISMASWIFDMKWLMDSMGMNMKIETDDFIHTILAEPQKVLDVFSTFCDVAFHWEPTSAHYALAKIAIQKWTTICTENFDRLQERTWIKAYHISWDDMSNRYNPEYFKEIDAIICIWLSHDDRGLLWWYKQYNPHGKIIALDLQQPEYLGNEDYLVQLDLQQILPKIAGILK